MILEVNKLRKEVSSGESKLVILDDVSFNLLEGQSLAITGPSGSGKSTLLGLLAGLDTATSGEIYLNGEALHELDEEQRALLRKEKVGFVFQSFELLPSLTALENVMLPSELKAEDEPEERAKYFLDRVGLNERKHHYPNQLSGGRAKGGRALRKAKSASFLRPGSPQHPWPQVGLLRSRPDLVPRLFIPRFLPETDHDTRVMWGRDINVRLREPHGRFRRPKAFGPP